MFKYKILFLALLYVFISGCGADERPIPEGYTRGIVLETMNSGGYTYMLLDQDEGEVWIAAQEMQAAKDDTVYYTTSMEMKDFHSETMNRTFKKIIFSDNCTKDPWGDSSENSKMGAMSENPHKSATNAKIAGLKIESLKDGYTVEKLYEQKSTLAGKTVKIRGQVVKFNAYIMGSNWVHLQDGTGDDKHFDLVVTTKETVNIGDVVVFEGVFAIDKDFGNNYKFEIIIENAVLIKEMNKI